MNLFLAFGIPKNIRHWREFPAVFKDYSFLCFKSKDNMCIDAGNGKDAGKVSGRTVDSDMHDVGRFLNRLLGLPPDNQNKSMT